MQGAEKNPEGGAIGGGALGPVPIAAWKFRNNKDKWEYYPGDTAALIEGHYQKHQPHASFAAANGEQYRIDFATMTQTNVAWGTARPVVRELTSSASHPTPAAVDASAASTTTAAAAANDLASSSSADAWQHVDAVVALLRGLGLAELPRFIGTTPKFRTSTSITFVVESGDRQKLAPGQLMLFRVPQSYQNRIVRTIILAHRKDKAYAASIGSSGKDSQGVYTGVSTVHKGKHSSWPHPKFAELRPAHDPEFETLHEWNHYVAETPAEAVVVRNVSKAQQELAVGHVHLLQVELFPAGQVESVQEEVFTPNTAFAAFPGQGSSPPGSSKTPTYGGGPSAHLSAAAMKQDGLYPGALVIGPQGNAGAPGPDTYSAQHSKWCYVGSSSGSRALHIRLPPGKLVGCLEVSCGDTAFDRDKPPDQQKNQDGHYGVLGWAKLFVRLKSDEKGRHWMYNANVPPNGVLSGGPPDDGYVSKVGDEIVVRSEHHPTWVMAYRVVFMKPSTV